ncbi:MAG: AAA family ATPase [Oscillospiraceae bacterium]|nr:AAA family ATPase [Oscillospiraceae bacterium]
MGTYINPGNASFAEIVEDDYIDKTNLIDLINNRIGTNKKLICISRPRRFGKSFAAKMLASYYDCSCDSHKLFDDKKIASCSTYERYLNKYNVICFDVTSFISSVRRKKKPLSCVTDMIVESLRKELLGMFSYLDKDMSLTDCILRCVEGDEDNPGRKFVFIIDEWDAIIRESKDDASVQKQYLDLLREWFKNIAFTPKTVAAAYMTGILPIKKDGSQSAISDFDEYTMIEPEEFGEYVGFTEDEVKKICDDKNADFSLMKSWYDGYSFDEAESVYNPNSVIKAARRNKFASYWIQTSSADALMEYISLDYSGLTKTIAELMAGIEVNVTTTKFKNDLTNFKSKDDVITLLIHLGYLAYDSAKKTARIPNEEIRQEFQDTIRDSEHTATIERLKESDKLFEDTIEGNEEAVAAQIEKIHMEETSPIHYNREDSLRSVIKLAYYTYRDNYVQWEEIPAGNGYADIAYLPKYDSGYPILVIELKWNKDAKTAIDQIKNRQYPESFKGFGRDIILVGITYDKDEKPGQRKHFCRIEKVMMENE